MTATLQPRPRHRRLQQGPEVLYGHGVKIAGRILQARKPSP